MYLWIFFFLRVEDGVVGHRVTKARVTTSLLKHHRCTSEVIEARLFMLGSRRLARVQYLSLEVTLQLCSRLQRFWMFNSTFLCNKINSFLSFLFSLLALVTLVEHYDDGYMLTIEGTVPHNSSKTLQLVSHTVLSNLLAFQHKVDEQNTTQSCTKNQRATRIIPPSRNTCLDLLRTPQE